MQLSRSIVAFALVGVLAAACGGGAASKAPAGATQGPGATTVNPGQTQSGGGGGAIDTSNGKIHIEIHGPIEKTTDLGFFPGASLFGASGQVSSLSFTNDATSEIATINVTVEGNVTVIYQSLAETIPGAVCTTSNLNLGSTSASGSFDCTAALAVTASGASLQGVTLKGNFDAHN